MRNTQYTVSAKVVPVEVRAVSRYGPRGDEEQAAIYVNIGAFEWISGTCINGRTKRKFTHGAALVFLIATVGAGTLPTERAAAQGATGSNYILNFKAYNGQFVVSEWGGGREVKADRNTAGDWERFVVVDLNGGELASGDKVHLRAQNGKFLVAENGMMKANRDVAGTWETFTIMRVAGSGPVRSNDKVNLRAWDGRYLVAERGGGKEVKADRTKAGDWEGFTVTVRSRLAKDPSPLGTTWSPPTPAAVPAPPLPPDGYTLVGQRSPRVSGQLHAVRPQRAAPPAVRLRAEKLKLPLRHPSC